MTPLVPVARLDRVGASLRRPECVVCSPSGDVYVPEWPGGVTVVRADGTQHTWRARTTIDLRPNGIAFDRHGACLIANLGDEGGVWRLDTDGTLTPFVAEIDGLRLPPANFVTVDEAGRTWISVSTRLMPRQQAWREHIADGFVVLVDQRGARVVLDGLHYTNEVRVDPTGRWLYIVETFGRRVRRWRIRPEGRLTDPEVVVTLGHGCFPDGFAFDEEGGVWITSLISNRLLHWHEGRTDTIVEDLNVTFVDAAERAFAGGTLGASHLGEIPDTTLQHVTSVAFGGADRRTVYLGTLHGSCVYRFRSHVTGAAPAHWPWPLP